MPQLERQGLLEDHHIHALAELCAQQRLAQRQSALRAGDARHQAAFQQHQSQYAHGVMTGGIARRDHGVHDLRPDPGDPGRQQAGSQGQQSHRQQQRAIGVPDQLYRAPAVAEHAEEAEQHVAIGRRRRRRGACRPRTVWIHAVSSTTASGS